MIFFPHSNPALALNVAQRSVTVPDSWHTVGAALQYGTGLAL